MLGRTYLDFDQAELAEEDDLEDLAEENNLVDGLVPQDLWEGSERTR